MSVQPASFLLETYPSCCSGGEDAKGSVGALNSWCTPSKGRMHPNQNQSFFVGYHICVYTGWWFGTFFYFSIQLRITIPTDFHMFQRGGSTTNQIYIYIYITGFFWVKCHPNQKDCFFGGGHGDWLNPIVTIHDWGNKYALTSYFRVPSGYQGFDPKPYHI